MIYVTVHEKKTVDMFYVSKGFKRVFIDNHPLENVNHPNAANFYSIWTKH